MFKVNVINYLKFVIYYPLKFKNHKNITICNIKISSFHRGKSLNFKIQREAGIRSEPPILKIKKFNPTGLYLTR